jgi:NADPH:quinone reductase
MRAIHITRYGGPEVLRVAEVPEPEASDGQSLLDVSAAGVNFADTHKVENSYMEPSELPFVPGLEVVGRDRHGRRVAALLGSGGYAERALAQPAMTFPVPDGVGDEQALAVLLQGLTAWHILRSSARVGAGESVVVFAAAGGVGSLAVQLAKRFGAGRVVAVASTPHKRELALELGADTAVDATSDDLTAAIREANGGRRVDVVLEMVGGVAFAASLAALAPLGRLVYYGNAGREVVPPVDPAQLMRRSVGVIGFWLSQLVRQPPLLSEPVRELLDAVADGSLRPVIGSSYALSDARRAHEELRARRTTGKLVLIP